MLFAKFELFLDNLLDIIATFYGREILFASSLFIFVSCIYLIVTFTYLIVTLFYIFVT